MTFRTLGVVVASPSRDQSSIAQARSDEEDHLLSEPCRRATICLLAIHGLQGTDQEVRNAKRVGATPEILTIERLSLDEKNAKDVTPLSIGSLISEA